jgi:hypothetical protein
VSLRREVRVADSFFEELDTQLSAERGPNGEPSATDFIILDLPRIVEEFSLRFDGLPEAVPDVGAVRMLVGIGTLTIAYVVHGVETSTGRIELLGVELDQ